MRAATAARPNAKFKGFGRSATDKDGVFSFDTVKPGAVPGPGGKPQAPHIVVCIFSRGMLRQIYTRLYFSDEAGQRRRSDPAMVPADRRGTLIAHKETGDGRAGLPLRHPCAGRQRNGFLRYLKPVSGEAGAAHFAAHCAFCREWDIAQ